MTRTKNDYLADRERSTAFDEALLKRIRNDLEEVRTSFIPKENTLSFSHGHRWKSQPTEFGTNEGEFKRHSVEFSLPFEAILQNRVDEMGKFHHQLVQGMQQSFMSSVFETVSEATERTGNTVSASDHDNLAAAYLDAMKRVEFGVDRDGNISMPEFYGNREITEKFLASLNEQGSEFRDELERVKAEKTAAAFAREKERLAKFLSKG